MTSSITGSVAPLSHARSQPQSIWLWGAAVFCVVVLVFLNCLLNAFVWDDEQFIVKNVFLTSWRYLPKLFTSNVVAGAGLMSNLYRPVQMLTHFLDVQAWGYHAWAHHLSTVLIHAAASVAVLRVLANVFSLWPALLTTLIFALHPLQSEAVAYTCGRGDGLALLFLCLGLLASHRHPWRAGVWVSLGMLSKEYLALFPLFLLLYDYARSRTLSLKQLMPFWALSGAYVITRLTILNFKNLLNFYDQPNVLTQHLDYRVYTYLTTIPKGLSLWLWPTDLHHERSWSVFTGLATPKVMGSLFLVVALLGASGWLRRRWRPAAAGIWWFFLATVPTSNLVVLINALFYDHWFILPGLGLMMVVAQGLDVAFSRGAWVRCAATALSVAAILACAGLAMRANRLWRTPITLYSYILSKEPRSPKITNNLAMAYADAGQLDKAIPLYQQAIALSDEFPQTHHNLANAYLILGDEARALDELKRAVAMDPRFHHSWIALGALSLKRNALPDAAEAFQHALDAYPYDARAYLGLAQVRLAQGDSRTAQSILESGLKVQPEHPALQAALEQLRPKPQPSR